MAYLIDTNVVSELRKRDPNANVIAWYEGVASHDLFLSAVTIGEVRLGIERLRRKDPAQAEILERWLDTLRTTYRDRIIDVDADIAEKWGRFNVPDPMPVLDGLLAATASSRGYTLVTRNVKGIANCGVAVLNPFGS
jgi:predicted nucleic acid-binding protein